MALLFAGAAFAAYGAWAFFDKRAALDFGGEYGLAFVRTTLPGGVGVSLFGAASMVGGEPRAILTVLGAAAIVLSWFLYYVHPRWAQPRWMQSEQKGSDSSRPAV